MTNGSWLNFAEGGGLERREWWTDEGWAWKECYDDVDCPGARAGHPDAPATHADVVRGRRLRPRAPRAPADRGGVGEGVDLEAPRRRGGAAGHRTGLGVDGVGVQRATRASSPTPTASTPRSSSTAATASCAAAPGRPTRGSPPRRSATGTSRSAGRSSPACGWPATRRPDVEPLLDAERILVESFLGPGDERALADDVLDGLTRPFKELPPKHFYDARGAELFDRITELPEYYPTRAERADPRRRRGATSRRSRAPGSSSSSARGPRPRRGSCCGAMHDAGHAAPLRPARRDRGDGPRDGDRARRRSCPGSRSTASSATSSATSTASRRRRPAVPRIVAFLGGTIGNFTPGSRRRFLRARAPRCCARASTTSCWAPTSSRTRRCSRRPTTTRRASRPSSTATSCTSSTASSARTSTSTPSSTSRSSTASASGSRCACARSATCTSTSAPSGSTSRFAAREELRTEISAKFTRERLAGDLAAAGLALVRVLTDPEDRFALSLSTPRR